MMENIYEYVKSNLSYDNEDNFQMFTQFYDEKQDAIEALDNAEQQELHQMFMRCMQIIYLETWLHTEFEELDCKKYIKNSEYSGWLFADNVDVLQKIFENADAGEAEEAFFLGNQFIEDKFSPALSVFASKYFRIAAEKGNQDAMWELGLCYRWGTGGEFIDIDKALYWFEKAAALGHEKARSVIEQFDSPEDKMILENSAISGAEGFGTKWYNSKKMVDEYYRLAKEGDVEAQYELGRQLTPGIAYGAFKRNAKEAAKYYEMAAKQGMIDAMYNLANLYEDGDIQFDKDLEKAFYWRKKCADEGDEEACYMVGKMYYNGKGTEVDKEKGKEYMMKAAEEGFEKAEDFLDDLTD